MNPRLRTALFVAVSMYREEAARIRAALPEYDGAPDAPPRRTPDGLWESDAAEYDEDALLIHDLIKTLWPLEEGANAMSDPVTLTVWRDAKTEQPPDYFPVLTDLGLAFRYESEGEVNWTGEISGSELSEEPKVWAKLPNPPADDPLTLDGLRLVLDAAEYVVEEHDVGDEPDLLREAAVRLHKALEGANP